VFTVGGFAGVLPMFTLTVSAAPALYRSVDDMNFQNNSRDVL